MKKSILLCMLFAFVVDVASSFAQTAPVWIKDINAYPDSAMVFPVRTLHDANNNVYVLCTYQKQVGPTLYKSKVYLRKYDYNGLPAWSLNWDNNGSGDPRGFDMVLDGSGNCYIAGGFMTTAAYKPMLIKVSSGGAVQWQRDSTSAFNTGNYEQIFLYNSKLYLLATYGLAQFDINGNEQWAHGAAPLRLAVDKAGQAIYSAFMGNPLAIFRCDSNGVLNFSDTGFVAKRIATDADNSFYILVDNPSYQLVKYDSAGVIQWTYSAFPAAPPFGDIGFELLIDNNNDVIIVGLSDTMYKLTPSGSLVWYKSMNSMDSYLIAASITYNNLLAVGGTVPGATGNDMQVALFDLHGNQNWAGFYSGNPNLTEFTVDMTIDNSGIYVVENNNQVTTFVKFDSPLNSSLIDFTLICVDSVWYPPGNLNYINVRLFNGNINHLNYPSVRMVATTGDTVSNPQNSVSFFAHLGNSYQTYYDTIIWPFITDFSTYTFLLSTDFGDTTVIIPFCNTAGINENQPEDPVFYPNPVDDVLTIGGVSLSGNACLEIFSVTGALLMKKKPESGPLISIDVSAIPPGIYIISLQDGNKKYRSRMLKM